MSELQKKFEKATKEVTKAKTDPGNDMKLRLYAHFKQSTDGDVTGDKPGFTDFVGRADWGVDQQREKEPHKEAAI